MQVLVDADELRRLIREEAHAAVSAALSAAQAPQGLLTAKQAGERLGMSESALRRSSQRNEIPCLRLPSGRVRYDASALDNWARSGSV